MELESLLKEYKLACHSRLGKPSGERLAYTGHLDQLMRQHLALERRDARRHDTREQMLAKGVPLVTVRDEQPVSEDHIGEPMPSRVRRGLDDDMWDCGNDDWPVTTEVLDSFFKTSPKVRAVRGGVSVQARSARALSSTKLLIKDAMDIPRDTTFQVRLSCQQQHPGLCAHRDRAIYPSALQLARSMEKCLHKGLQYKFICVWEPDNDAESAPFPKQYFYVASIRTRRLHKQVTHVLVRCQEGWGDDVGMTLELAQAVIDHKWAFITLWTLAREVLEAGVTSLRIGTFDYTDVDGNESSIVPRFDPGNPSWAVWPDEFRPAPRPRQANEIPDDPLDRLRKKKKKPPTGGVKAGRGRRREEGEYGGAEPRS